MTWTKLGDEYDDQCWRLSDAAYRTHNGGLIWSNRRHLDGRLLKDEMRLWAKRPEAAEELVREGFWEDQGDSYQIVAHQGWQHTAAQWRHRSEVNRANRAKRTHYGSNRSSDEPLDESINESLDEKLHESSNETVWSGRVDNQPEKRKPRQESNRQPKSATSQAAKENPTPNTEIVRGQLMTHGSSDSRWVRYVQASCWCRPGYMCEFCRGWLQSPRIGKGTK